MERPNRQECRRSCKHAEMMHTSNHAQASMQKLTLLAPCVPASGGACFRLPSCDWHRSNVCTPAAITNTSLGNRTALATRKTTWTTPIIGLAVDPCSRSIQYSTAPASEAPAVHSRRCNAMHGRAMRTSCGSMPATVTSATAALASAAALLKPTWVGLVGGAELHRSHRTQPEALLKADTCCSRLHAPTCAVHSCRTTHGPIEQGTAGAARARTEAHAGGDLLAALRG